MCMQFYVECIDFTVYVWGGEDGRFNYIIMFNTDVEIL